MPDPKSRKTVSRPSQKKRLPALDALRGFDMLLLVFAGPFISALAAGPFHESFLSSNFLKQVAGQLTPSPWIGYTVWDQIMPLFIFIAGAAIPYALAPYKGSEGGKKTWRLWFRLIRRFCLLWLIGAVLQGNLLSLKWETLRLYCNTLQAVAVGYLFSAVFYLFLSLRWQIIVTAVLLLSYWGLEKFIHFDNIGGGTYIQGNTFAEWVDQKLLTGKGTPNDIQIWILPSLNFIATAMMGVFAGMITRIQIQPNNTATPQKGTSPAPANTNSSSLDTCLILAVIGAALSLAGYMWSKIPAETFGYSPIIRNLWTSSMTLLSSGLSFMLFAVFYLITEIWQFKKEMAFFTILGTNSLLAYIFAVFHGGFFRSDAQSVLVSIKEHLGSWFPTLLVLANFAISFLILWALYKNKKFLRV